MQQSEDEKMSIIGCEQLHKETGFVLFDRFAKLEAKPLLASDACYLTRHDDLERAMQMVPRISEAEARLAGYNSTEEEWMSHCEQQGIDVQEYLSYHEYLSYMESKSPQQFPVDDEFSIYQR